jgi:predicted porin
MEIDMKNKIIVLTLAMGSAPFAAKADVTLYGFLSASVESVSSTGANNGINAPRQTRVSDQTSRLGFKGTEDLGNGNTAIWQIENAIKFTNGGTGLNGSSSTFGSRNTFVGLGNNTSGTLLAGYNDSAYRRFTTMDVGTDFMVNTTAGIDVATNYQGVVNRGDSRMVNSVHYNSPKWNGFQGGISWGADENSAHYTSGGAEQRWSFAANYTNGGLIVAAGYDRQNNVAASLSSTVSASSTYAESVTASANSYVAFSKLAIGYNFATGTYLGAAFEHGNLGTRAGTSGGMTQNDYTLAMAQRVGRARFMLSYNKLAGLNNAYIGNAKDWEAKQWVVGTSYDLSKTTTLFGYWTQISNGAYQNQTLIQQVYDSGTFTTSGVLNAGSKVSALGAGLRVAF